MTMVSVQARNLFNDILCLAHHDIVTERLPHSPLIRWADYSTMKDRQDGFRLDYSCLSTSLHIELQYRCLHIGAQCQMPVCTCMNTINNSTLTREGKESGIVGALFILHYCTLFLNKTMLFDAYSTKAWRIVNNRPSNVSSSAVSKT